MIIVSFLVFLFINLYSINCYLYYKKNIILNMSTSKINSGGIRNMQIKYQKLFKNSILLSNFDKNKIRISKFYLFFDLIYYIIKYNPKIIISHCSKITRLLKIISFFINIPFLIHVIHGNNYCNNLENSDIIFYLNNYHKEKLKKLNLINKSYYFPNFLTEYEIEKKIVTITNIKNIGIIGRFSKEKNFETVIKSMKYLKNFNLYIAGDGFLKNIYNKIINENKLKNVYFLGWIDSNKFFEKIDIFIIPSIDEAFPLVILEAMKSCKPIISSITYGSKQALNETENCLFINNVLSAKEYADKILFLKNNKILINQMSINNFNKFKNNYTLECAKKNINIIFKDNNDVLNLINNMNEEDK